MQKFSKFIYPDDFVTILLAAFVIIDVAFSITGIDWTWYIPLVAGYVLGYIILGRTSYVMLWETDLADKCIRMTPWVIWDEGGRTYLQVQSNRELLKRLLFNVRHEVTSNVPLDPDWYTVMKYPLFPNFQKPAVIVEDIRTSSRPEHLFWRFSVIHYATEISVAYGGQVSRLQLANDQSVLTDMQRQNNRLILQVRDLRAQQGPALMEMSLKLEEMKQTATPANRAYEMLRYEVAKERGDDEPEPPRYSPPSDDEGGEDGQGSDEPASGTEGGEQGNSADKDNEENGEE